MKTKYYRKISMTGSWFEDGEMEIACKGSFHKSRELAEREKVSDPMNQGTQIREYDSLKRYIRNPETSDGGTVYPVKGVDY